MVRLNAESLELVARFHAGDTEAIARLHELWAGRLLTYFHRGLQDRHEAEDAVQAMAVTMIVQLGRYEIRSGTPFGVWLFAIAHKRVVDELRRRRRVSVSEPATLAEWRERDQTVTNVADWVECHAMRDALSRLPERQRQVLMLEAELGVRMDEIAAALDMTTDAVYKTHQRARAAMSAALGRPPAATRVTRSPMRRRDIGQPVLRARRLALLAA